jgi:hypothetical protein
MTTTTLNTVGGTGRTLRVNNDDTESRVYLLITDPASSGLMNINVHRAELLTALGVDTTPTRYSVSVTNEASKVVTAYSGLDLQTAVWAANIAARDGQKFDITEETK